MGNRALWMLSGSPMHGRLLWHADMFRAAHPRAAFIAGCLLAGAQVNCYNGTMQDGKRHGEGTFTYPNRFFKYEGEYRDGQKHGACVARCPGELDRARPLPPTAYRRS
jgi:hypothetical protein